MTRLRRLLLVTFAESFATIIVERGIYFYTRETLGYSDVMNLSLALAMGVAYVVGALASHGLAARIGEKRLLLWSIAFLGAMHLVLLMVPHGPVLVLGVVAVGLGNGLKWPVVESYVGAGRSAGDASRAVGVFNLAWSSAVPLSLAATGPLISWHPELLFVLGAGINAWSLWLLRRLAARPTHLPHDHPDRPDSVTLHRYGRLLASSRWSMLSSYSLLFLLSPLMPGVFARLGVPVAFATALAALLDVMRVLTFLVFQRWSGWHGRTAPVLLATLGVPVGFALALFGPSVGVVLAGEILFGVAAGATYYAALFYAMVVKNASVDAGGVHEGLIGAGFTVGPLLGLVGLGLAAPLGGAAVGLLAGVGPFMVLCLAASLRALRLNRLDA